MFLRFVALAALALAPSQAMAAWNEAKSNHFIVYSELSQDQLRSYVTISSATTPPFAWSAR